MSKFSLSTIERGTQENRSKQGNVWRYRSARCTRPVTWAAVLAAAFTSALPAFALADEVIPPPVPPELQILVPSKAFMVGHAVGTQNYVCQPSGAGVAFSLFTPEATLFSDDESQLTTHFFSPLQNSIDPATVPDGTIRATWLHSRDSSTVWAEVKPGNASTDARFVAVGAVPWLLLTMSGVKDGPTGGDVLSKTTFVHRLNTQGGAAPSTGCDSPADIGKRVFVPYTADYFFYKPR